MAFRTSSTSEALNKNFAMQWQRTDNERRTHYKINKILQCTKVIKRGRQWTAYSAISVFGRDFFSRASLGSKKLIFRFLSYFIEKLRVFASYFYLFFGFVFVLLANRFSHYCWVAGGWAVQQTIGLTLADTANSAHSQAANSRHLTRVEQFHCNS